MTTPPTEPSPASRRTLTARTPDDVLAVVPVVLGFVPERSVVMLTLGATRPFHARVDLPAMVNDVPAMVACLLDPARRHRVRSVVFVIYSEDAVLSARTWRALERGFRTSGIRVVDGLRADGKRWFVLGGSHAGVPRWGVPYDVTAHPFAAQSVVDGQVTHGSRDELAATLRSDPAGVRAVADALAALPTLSGPAVHEVAWVSRTVADHLANATVPGDDDAARLLRALGEDPARDIVWLRMDRAGSSDHVRLWTDLVRRSPRDLLAAPAALLAFAGWLSGHGALAWCALDRCFEVEPTHVLAGQLARALIEAVPPSVWEDEDDDDLDHYPDDDLDEDWALDDPA